MDNKKKRCVNWSEEEKDMLKQLILASAAIIENKGSSTEVNMKKNKEWKEITNRLNIILNKKKRWTETQVKMAWKRMKLNAKANVSKHKHLASQTDDREKPPSPTTEEELIMAISPHDFIEESNSFDSDAISKNSAVCKGRQKIVDSDIQFKQKHLKMLEEMHKYNLQIAKLKIKKLELEIAKLEEN